MPLWKGSGQPHLCRYSVDGSTERAAKSESSTVLHLSQTSASVGCVTNEQKVLLRYDAKIKKGVTPYAWLE